jgi:DNA-binding LacI/PurR family transcriptional regulator
MATIYDIAKAAGVTQTTVANALAGKDNVSEATRQRILKCVQEMGYRPNEIARSLAQGKTFTLALILPTISIPFYPEMAEAVEHTAMQHDYQLLLCNTHNDATLGRRYLERLISRWVDGLIIMGASLPLDDIAAQVERGLPVVLCDWQENETPDGIPNVSVDFRQAGVLAAQHLIALGHRRLAVIVDEPMQILRLEGFRAIAEEAGIILSPEYVRQGHSTIESSHTATKLLLALTPRPTAIFATTDWMALGAMQAIIEAGLRIPDDISIIGLDDIIVSAHISPALTTVAIPKEQLAAAAMEVLLSQIAGQDGASASVVIPPHLIVRQSTAPVPITG